MENYLSASRERHEDFHVLDRANRHTAAMHIGGIAIECLLKSILVDFMPVNAKGNKEWKTETNDPGHTIHNPNHNYRTALLTHNKLRTNVQNNPLVHRWLQEVEYCGCHFIDMRYLESEPEETKYKQWRRAYTGLVQWLEIEATKLGQGRRS